MYVLLRAAVAHVLCVLLLLLHPGLSSVSVRRGVRGPSGPLLCHIIYHDEALACISVPLIQVRSLIGAFHKYFYNHACHLRLDFFSI